MTHTELTRELQLERANLIAHISACRRMLGAAQGMLQANKMIHAKFGTGFTPFEDELLGRIDTYLQVGMFDQLPEGIAQ